MKKIFALFLILFTSMSLQTSFGQLNLAPDNKSVLILDPTVSGGAGSAEASAAAAAGVDNYGTPYTVVVVPSWAGYTAIDFASYRAIVVGDPFCQFTGPEASAIATANIWGPVVNATGGKVIIIGTDPRFHYGQGGDSLIYGGMRFVLADDPGRTKTGAYMCLSCYYNNYCQDTVKLLSGLALPGQAFTMDGGSGACPIGCFDNIHKTANAPQLANVNDGNLGPWGCSVHEIFSQWDELQYDVFAIGLGLLGNYTAPDGTVGSPYILTRGAAVISAIQLGPQIDTNVIGDPHTLTATVTLGGSPVAGIPVTFNGIGGPCPGVIGVANTDNAGMASVTYTCNTVGTQFITASASVGGVIQTSNTVIKVWIDSPLPVELSAFTATSTGREVTLNWTTTMELNNAGFDIERALVTGQNLNWTRISNVAGNGTTNEIKNYSFVDRNINPGRYTYRLKQIDFNGNFAYHNLSSEIEIGIPNTFALSQNYPNPFNPTTKIGFQIPTDGNVVLSVFDNSGKLVSTILNGFKPAGYYTVDFNASGISSGIYFYKIQYSANGQDLLKVMKMAVIK
ncbi:MAG TPA: T9SS type A sorting domain-containing protein [Ignavibacteria bacterium]|nr:T9SS type A sorting domain-containing protein [Ignavibacteria bacterium]